MASEMGEDFKNGARPLKDTRNGLPILDSAFLANRIAG
jgi:hypothetical protein